ncbi:oxalurate catabolism protein HpxZ [Aquabacterium sp.]|uniref:oxalurate catabolism protein HpxZ n=1 Tax=Aquabacterium sp. TaxID=1872578 RepID=UPI00248792F8|nr:oxalurate catabolism protein HpxZ [Aquabacterium sp.]MDI1259963.1 oxalurate catabolism protein HpxZ [Aquabacterium sp.]
MTLSTGQLNHPEVLQEVTAVFLRYEEALVANDVDALNAYFWANPCTTRYGIGDKQLGHEALVAYRLTVPPPDYTRQLHEVRITAFGPDLAVAMTEFTRSDTTLRGFQTQTWVRFSDGWKIVSAHVSMIPFTPG